MSESPTAVPSSQTQLGEGTFTETPDLAGAFPRLEPAQIETLAAHGERRHAEVGDVLITEGEPDPAFYVVLSGLVAVVEGYQTPGQRMVRVHGPRRFLGELGMLTGQVSLFTSVVVAEGEVLAVPVEKIRKLVTQDSGLGDEILRAYLIRRSLSIGQGVGFRIIGSQYSADTLRLREFASRNRLPHRFIDLETDVEAEHTLRQLDIGPRDVPLVVWGKRMLRNPSNAELAAMIGMRTAPEDNTAACDLLVVGAGPAGLAAGVYGASEGLHTVVLDAVAAGGQAATSSRIENYLGFPAGISGAELAERAVIQADKFGAHTQVPVTATALRREDGHYRVQLDNGAETLARTVVVATGARYRKLPVDRLQEFEETSVFYAATQIEAQICDHDPVVVVGGGNSAGQATLFLADHAAKVRLVVRERTLDEFMSRYLADRILADPRIEVLPHTEVRELIGERGMLEAVVVEDNTTGQRRRLDARELMVFIGATPCTAWLAGAVELDSGGYIRTGPAAAERAAEAFAELGRPPLPLETSAPGVFAAGDVRSGSVQRVASAVGEGAMAVRLVHEHLSGSLSGSHSGSHSAGV
ncbi:MAG: thioredoxin reductase [Pseudonocardiales bacterium]|nr:thioredoxin reductase [Pseudonocardiales bacterium]